MGPTTSSAWPRVRPVTIRADLKLRQLRLRRLCVVTCRPFIPSVSCPRYPFWHPFQDVATCPACLFRLLSYKSSRSQNSRRKESVHKTFSGMFSSLSSDVRGARNLGQNNDVGLEESAAGSELVVHWHWGRMLTHLVYQRTPPSVSL
jgi:hypothetical protein